jgi:hypothetical protein
MADGDAIAPQNLTEITSPASGLPRVHPPPDLRRAQHLLAAAKESSPSAALDRPAIQRWRPWTARWVKVTDVSHILRRASLHASDVVLSKRSRLTGLFCDAPWVPQLQSGDSQENQRCTRRGFVGRIIMRDSRTCFSRFLIAAASLIAASTAAVAGEQVSGVQGCQSL